MPCPRSWRGWCRARGPARRAALGGESLPPRATIVFEGHAQAEKRFSVHTAAACQLQASCGCGQHVAGAAGRTACCGGAAAGIACMRSLLQQPARRGWPAQRTLACGLQSSASQVSTPGLREPPQQQQQQNSVHTAHKQPCKTVGAGSSSSSQQQNFVWGAPERAPHALPAVAGTAVPVRPCHVSTSASTHSSSALLTASGCSSWGQWPAWSNLGRCGSV